MKIRHTATPLPTCFKDHPAARNAVLVSKIRLVPTSRLWMAVLVFEKPKDLHEFWRKGLDKDDLGKGCLGAVNSMGREVFNFAKGAETDNYMEVDPHWFAVMGLTLDNLSMEIICHEAVHAGYAYTTRANLRGVVQLGKDNEEELLAYPVGMIAARVNTLLHDNGIYELAAKNKKA